MIPGHVVGDLCSLGLLGESKSLDAQSILKRLARRSRIINTSVPQTWNTVADSLDTSQLINLVQGLLLAEEAHRWRGSTSGVIWAFFALVERDVAAADMVAAWGADKSTNTYVPFSNRRRKMAERRAGAGEVTRLELEQADAERRRLERSQSVKQHVQATVRNTRDRSEFLSTVDDLPVADRLRALLRNRNRSPSWFPAAWATDALALVAVGTLDTILRDELIERLTGYRKGPWKRLHDALVAARDGGGYNNVPW